MIKCVINIYRIHNKMFKVEVLNINKIKNINMHKREFGQLFYFLISVKNIPSKTRTKRTIFKFKIVIFSN